MREAEFGILNAFKNNREGELSTSAIVELVFPDETAQIREGLLHAIHSEAREAVKKRDAQLHRRLLHYLNKLTDEGILELVREGRKGEKFFRLSLAPSERFVIDRYKRRIVIERTAVPAMPIEGYEQKGFLFRFEPDTWVDRLNAILLEVSRFDDINQLHGTIVECFSHVNDVIGLNDFETLVQRNESSAIIEFLRKLDTECRDYGKRISCVIDCTNIVSDEDKLFAVLASALNLERVTFIYDVRARELRERKGILLQVLDLYSRNKQCLYVKNQDAHAAPYILGSIGPYTFAPAEWALYKVTLQQQSSGLACAQSSITADVSRFFEHTHSQGEFREMVMAVGKALLTANSLQRRKSSEYFRTLIRLMPKFFIYSRNYVRFWNYGWKEPGINPEDTMALIRSAKEGIQRFCSSEEIIYRSCGMPTRFKIAFSCGFEGADESMSKARFSRLRLSKAEDLHSKDMKELLQNKEKVFELFDGGDRVRFLRVGAIEPTEILTEINILTTSYSLPFIGYDFGDVMKDNSLKRFI